MDRDNDNFLCGYGCWEGRGPDRGWNGSCDQMIVQEQQNGDAQQNEPWSKSSTEGAEVEEHSEAVAKAWKDSAMSRHVTSSARMMLSPDPVFSDVLRCVIVLCIYSKKC